MPGLSPLRSLALAGIPILALFVGGTVSKSAFAAPGVPNPRPSAPAISPSVKKIPDNPFRCDRLIKHRGKTLPCDSALRRDGESLRAIMEKTPSAIDELEKYQAGRNSIKFAAYTGTAGLLILAASGLIADLVVDSGNSGKRDDVAKILRFSGGGIALGSVVFGISHLRSNEDHLQQSILNYNAAHPDRPIEILFKTEF